MLGCPRPAAKSASRQPDCFSVQRFMRRGTYQLGIPTMATDPDSRPSPPAPEDDPGAEVPATSRRNLAVFLTHGLLGMTGFRLIQAPTFLPSYISMLTGSHAAVGLARAVQSLGMFLSPLFAASMVEARPRAKRLALLVGLGTRAQILVLALLALIAPEGVARVLIWFTIGAWGLCNGLQGVIFNELIAKTVPIQSRGRLVGVRNLGAGVSLLGVSALAGWILDRHGYPTGYGWAFLLSFVLASLGLLSLSFLVEGDTVRRRPAISLAERITQVPAMLKTSTSFSSYIAARLLATTARGALPFYILAVSERFGITGGRLAGLTIAFTLAQALSALPWGWLGDRAGYRLVYLLAQITWISGSVAILMASSLPSCYAVFVLVGSGMSGSLIAEQNLVLEFGGSEDRPMRVATSNSLAEACGALGFLGAGLLAEALPLNNVFVVSILFQIAGLLWLRRIRDPRHHQ